MRYVHFEKIVGLLRLVAHETTSLSAGRIEELGVKSGILLRADGRPFSRSTMYHYRKVMEHLGLLRLDGSTYLIGTSTAVEKLIAAPLDSTLSISDKETLASTIVNDQTCRRVFFDFMMDRQEYGLAELRSTGRAMRIISETAASLDSEGPFKVVPHGTAIQIVAGDNRVETLDTSDQINAIIWGLRLWALELGITDEMLLWYSTGRVVVPISEYPLIAASSSALMEAILALLNQSHNRSDWELVSIPSLLRTALETYRYPLATLKSGLIDLQQQHSDRMMFVPSSAALLDLRTPYEKQERLVRLAYVQLKNGVLASHIRVHTSLAKEDKLT